MIKEKFNNVVRFFKMLHFISKVTSAVCKSFVEVYGDVNEKQEEKEKDNKDVF